MTAAARPMVLIGRLGLGVFYAAPWAWLVAFATLFTLTIVQFGHVPTYGNPDPKQVAGAWLPYWTIYLLLIPTLLSPLVVMIETVARLVSRTPPKTKPLAVWALGFALFGSIAFANVFGLMEWVLD
jgi:hypothetical protein